MVICYFVINNYKSINTYDDNIEFNGSFTSIKSLDKKLKYPVSHSNMNFYPVFDININFILISIIYIYYISFFIHLILLYKQFL